MSHHFCLRPNGGNQIILSTIELLCLLEHSVAASKTPLSGTYLLLYTRRTKLSCHEPHGFHQV